ncbi:potassium transporter 26-like [Phoenix dactylifera]|uniref:Potassium transporter n=1 Tax=Phoenix dactylifera TaxID=42345 RepID=A0A8B7MXC6_PHODC|nr:potassium transporter 26-like [Phoenix dactylifera]
MKEARGGEAIVDIDDGNPNEDGEQEAAREGGKAVVYIESRSPKKGGEQARRILSFGNTYKIPKRQRTNFTWMQTLLLSYQSLGVVYGDIGTSPLYVFSSITLRNPAEEDILGILSLIFWTLTMLGLIKYVVTVLHADDHGEGGTFALYSLLRQNIHFKGKMIMPSTRLDSDINLRYHSKGSGLQSKAQKFLEKNSIAQIVITVIVLLGTCMVIGDGALTPAISVLSAVQGIQSRSSKITQDIVVILSVVILLILFLFQRYGTSKVSFSFSPMMLLWFGFTASIGVYNIIKFYPSVLKALSPHYIYYYFARNHTKGWELLGSIALCITGAEAMFADLGHFNKNAIQLAFSTLVYPALILAYAGEAAFLIKNPEKISTAFYSSVPEPIFWPMFVVATLAAIVASQALISASFSIIRQSMALGYFPRVTMRHTSDKYEGQVYSPEVNYFLMIACILLTVGFKGGAEIGNAFGVAVIWVMLITTFLMAVVMLVIWETNVFLVLLFLMVFIGIEGVYMTSLLHKVSQGGWVPFAISAFFLVITLSWTYGRSKKSEYEAVKKMDSVEFNQLVACSTRVSGICFFCTDLIHGIPPIVRHYVQHVSSLRKVMVFVTVRILPVRSVLPEERFLVAKLGSEGVYRCLVQYGYMDKHSMEGEEYIASVVSSLKEIAEDAQESEMLDSALNSGAMFVLGRIILQASQSSGWWRHFVINNLYRFLQKNFRSTVATLRIPPRKILQVGMVYEI